ncbi:MAG: flagellar basal body L-ring protein FlgH [Lentisphaeria bacterium]|nr:flagellar basal body L-ring protein FlgH [Lentisphaeria bacterium]NQZ70018.1 flagellar basal body L-ring protein FlgH [Lentisphaeria bacterium]
MKHIILSSLLLFSLSAEDELTLVSKIYSSQVAVKKGDLITIVISEATNSAKSESITTGKSGSASSSNITLGNATGGTLSKKLAALDLATAYNLNGSSTFDGSGSSSSSETLKATITARVVDIQKNGLLVIRGERQIKMKREQVDIIITGLIRTRDVSSSNSVNSSQISDLSVVYRSTGSVTDGTKKGWLFRFFEKINPF